MRKVLEQKGKKEEKSAWYFGTPKTESSNRAIKSGDTLYKALKHAKTTQKKNRLLYGEYYTKHYLKPEKDEKGNTIYRIIPAERRIECTLKRVDMVCVRENGEYISTDSFKYVKDVQAHRGHSDISTTLQIYTHATEAMADRSVDIFEKAASI